jgi:formylglycine-generating enzyme required for sulfatase activity
MSEESSPTHDVFVSYSSKDKNWADAACAVLERHRVRCWIAPRDITPGDEWGAAIVKGIHGSRMMVLIFSGNANNSGQVRREVERAISRGMNILPVRIEDVRPAGAMEYALGNMHWLDAFTPPVKQQLEVLARSVQTLLGRDGEPAAASAPAPARPKETQAPPPPPPTRSDDGPSSAVPAGVKVMSGRWRSIVLVGLPFLLGALMAVIILPRLLPSPAAEPGPVAVVPTPVPVEPAKRVTPLPPWVEPTPEPVELPRQITNSIGMKLVLIPSGEFLMGSPDSDIGAPGDERPQHRVQIMRPFYLGATEVTQGQYRTVTGQSPSNFREVDDLPVEQVSWNDAIAFCNKLSELEKGQLGGAQYRLPTEAEWEYACRGGATPRYSFGDDAASLRKFAWYDGNSGSKTHPVGEKRPNDFSLFDMHGNVWEWCQDWYDKDSYGQSLGADPCGPSQAAVRVVRGGGWYSDLQSCRSATRDRLAPVLRRSNLGFRVARVRSGP